MILMLNNIQLLFGTLTCSMVFVGMLMNLFEQHLPAYIRRTFRYGKFAYSDGKPFRIPPIEVPKSWFRHFYVFAAPFSMVCVVFLFVVYTCGGAVIVPTFMMRLIDVVTGVDHKVAIGKVTTTQSFVAMILLSLQCCRRWYDTQYISIFSSKSKINFSHYIIGFLHYAGACLAIFSDAPIGTSSELKLTHLSLIDGAGIVLFLWAWYHQYVVTVILANLRKSKKGSIVTEDHKLPSGDWFTYLTAPHMTAEMLMYVALTLIMRHGCTWYFVLGWVLSNQAEVALMNHWWYRNTFKDYPKERRALIPFVY